MNINAPQNQFQDGGNGPPDSKKISHYRIIGRAPSPAQCVAQFGFTDTVVMVLPRGSDRGLVVFNIRDEPYFAIYPRAIFSRCGKLEEIPIRQITVTGHRHLKYEVVSSRKLRTHADVNHEAHRWLHEIVNGMPIGSRRST